MGVKKGALFLVGGAADTVYADFVRLAGGPAAHIAVLTHASEIPHKRAEEIGGALRNCGVSRITIMMPEDSRLPDDVDAIFIGGGGQERLVRLLEQSGLGQQIRDAHRRGVFIAGTSAGAAAVTQVMMNGQTRAFRRNWLRLGSVLVARGLCLLCGVVVDTHFGQRKRWNRLRIVIGMFDDLFGIGLDEDTAVYIDGDICEVFGAHSVWTYRRGKGRDFRSIARGAVQTEYRAGDRFSLR